MLEITEAKDNNKSEWDAYIRSFPGAHLYHDYRWKGVLEETFGHESFYLTAEEDKKIVGIFPLFFVNSRIMAKPLISLPFLNYGGILANDGNIERFLLDRAVEILKARGAGYIEVRNQNKSAMPFITREHKVTMLLPLCKDIEEQWGRLDAKVRNQIRKAQKSGLAARRGKGDLLDEFYRVFAHNMRDLGTPVLGKNFFVNILKYFPEESNIFVAQLKNRAVAGAFSLASCGIMEVPWASSVRSFNKFCPNEFIYWEAIRFAVSGGLRQFDFGRCTKESGTYRFKKQWDPEIKQLYWQYWAFDGSGLPTATPQKSKYTLLINMWRKMPLFIANRLGPRIAKDIPVF